MRCGSFRVIFSVVLSLTCFARPGANPFPLISEIRLNDRLVAKGQAPIHNMSIFAISFSPAADRIAIQFGDDIDRDVLRLGQTKRQYLFVLSTGEGNPTVNWTEMPQIHSEGVRAEPVWSPDGNSLVIGTTRTEFDGGNTCKLPGGFVGFLSADRMLVSHRQQGPTTTLAIVDSHCQLQESWPIDWWSMGARLSPDGRQLAVLAAPFGHSSTVDLSKAELLLLPIPPEASAEPDFSRAKRIPAGPLRGTGVARIVFTNGAVCAPYEVTGIPIRGLDGEKRNGSRTAVQCWDAQSGKSMRQTEPLWTGPDIVLSAGGGRIAVSDSGIGLPANPGKGAMKPVPQIRGVWDLHSGKMLGLWSPDPDMHASLSILPIARRGIAISADGKVLAESTDDSVRLYRLP